MSSYPTLQQSVESSKIVLRFLEDRAKTSTRQVDSYVNKLRFIFTSAIEKNDDLEYCLACVFHYLENGAYKANVRINKNTFEIFSESEILESHFVKARESISGFIKSGYCEQLKPSDLYLESSLN